jgi:hypothetical protein
MREAAFDPAAIAADAVVLAELDGGTGHERVRIGGGLHRGRGGARRAARLSVERLDRRPAGSVPLTHPLEIVERSQ